jgi:peptidoglycan/LPS O-acetylase OafA/YrhL
MGLAGFLAMSLRDHSMGSESRSMLILGISLTTLLFGSLLALVLNPGRMNAMFGNGLLRQFGRYSYAIYLMHMPVWEIIGTRLPQPLVGGSSVPAQLAAYLVMGLMCLGGGWLSWNLLEKHVLGLKRKVPYGYQSVHTVYEKHRGATAPVATQA